MAGFVLFFICFYGEARGEGQYAAFSLLAEGSADSWTVWSGEEGMPGGKGSGWDQSAWGPGGGGRLDYYSGGFNAGVEYQYGKGEFPTLGKSTRHKYALDFSWMEGEQTVQGAYLGIRYYDFKFAQPTSSLHNHDFVEFTLGYALEMNPTGQGPFYKARVSSPTLFWLTLLFLAAQDNNAVYLNDFPLPLGLDFQLDAGYRFGPMELGMGYRFLYYDTFYQANQDGYPLPMSGIVHGVFARIKINLWLSL